MNTNDRRALLKQAHDIMADTPQYGTEITVYGGGSAVTFSDVESARAYAVDQNAATGATYEARDENFDHVFTVEV